MASYDFSAPRLFVDCDLNEGTTIPLEKAHRHYLRNVLRLSHGGTVLVFNGRDGEWRAELASRDGHEATILAVGETVRPQPRGGDLHYLFAPLKHARLDYMVQKAVEMGASALRPVVTRRTQVARVNLDRMRANAVEAAEQCGILAVPGVHAPTSLAEALRDWPAWRTLVFCDEDAEPGEADLGDVASGAPLAVLVGPEGGFDPAERTALLALPSVRRLSLGPRILRADTAAVAALALVQARLGDWRRESEATPPG